MPARRCGKSQLSIAREGFLDRRSKRCFWLLLSPQTKVARAGARNCPRRRQILRLRRRSGELAFPWRGGGLRRPHFFLRRKKCGKESRLDLRSKGPLARGGQVRIWRCVLAGGMQRSSLSVKRTVPAFTGAEASATAYLSHGRGICFYRVGDYQIAPLPPQGGKGRCARWAQDIIACDAAERTIFAVVAGSGSGKLCWHSRGNDNDQENAGYVRESAGGSEQA